MVQEWGFVLVTSIMAQLILPAQGLTDPDDVFALSVLYSNLNSPPLTGWKAIGGDPCEESWQGIQCAGPNVTAVNLSGESLGGSLGYALDRFTGLLTLDLSNNRIGQMIPYQLPPRIQELYLGNNQFLGSLPFSLSNLSSLTNLNVSNNLLETQIPDIFQDLSNLISLDLSSNRITGVLPASFGSLTSLSTLHLQDNQFSGDIDILGQLPIQDLDIENNQFSGWIPTSLLAIPSLRYAGNQLNATPALPPTPFTSPPLSLPRSPTGVPPKPTSGHKSPPFKGSSENTHSKTYWNVGRVVGIVFAAILSIAAMVLLAFFFKWRNQEKGDEEKRGGKVSSFGFFASSEKVNVKENINNNMPVTPPQKSLKPPPVKYKAPATRTPGKTILSKVSKIHMSATAYTVADLQMATNSFRQENLVGEGSFGRVYRAELPNGKLVAIKKLDSTCPSVQNEDNFLASISNLARLRHANIAELVGYCAEHGQRLLAYNYIEGGTLHDLLHVEDEINSEKLFWNVRVKIALGAARALEYLHEICLPAVIHKNFKSANILLGSDLNPHLSDCGIATLVHYGSERQVSAQLLGSFGYSAPEYAMSGIYTVKSDVYSFGVVMLELLTGRKPLDSCKPRAEQSLVRWATPQLHDIDALAKMVDPKMKGIYPAKSLSRFADIISLCVQPEPEFRPQMSEVVQALVRLMQRASPGKRRSGDDLGASQRSIDHQDPSDLSG
ncbi:hypothetical protein O6H91_10G016800 [Diphasiastrum complanatum]|uniref:Uncharacterized protein n=1 Tax=Diphasiastrum complanatum TaxID=34168 RepID=A0ACC2CEK2_DIPCM|nr:hypothetical protein O6H91_10G016800 [Diphasiastrum complanatum]